MNSFVTTFSYETNHGKLWGYRFEIAPVKGVRKWNTKRGFKNKSDAAREGRDAQNLYENKGHIIRPSEMSYSDFIDIWLTSLEGQVKPTTQNNYRKKVDNYIRPHLGKYKLNSIKKDDLRKLLKILSENGSKIEKNGLSKNTLTVIKGILVKSFNFAVDEHYLIETPIHGNLPIPKNEDIFLEKPAHIKPHVWIPKEQIEKIFNRFPFESSSYLPLMLGYRCGLRISEAFAITWDCIDFVKKTLTVNKQVQWMEDKTRTDEDKKKSNGESNCSNGYWYFSKPKYNSFRTIEIDDGLLELLRKAKQIQEAKYKLCIDLQQKYYYYYNESNKIVCRKQIADESCVTDKSIFFVCIRDCGDYVNSRTMQNTSRVIHKQLGFPEFDFHSLRHTHASELAENGALPPFVQNRLGHKDLSTTISIYYHYTDKMKEQGLNILNNMYCPK